jgi:hypothetical protein
MNPAQRLLLDVRIAEERMTELEPHGEDLSSLLPVRVDRVWTMNDAGVVGPWHWRDAVPWHEAVAYRIEDALGNPVELDDYDGDDFEAASE